MAYQNIQRVVDHLLAHPVVPVFYHDDLGIVKEVARVCYEAGIRSFEFTNRGANAHVNFAALRQFISSNCPEMALGIGTIFNYRTAKEFLPIGCDFVVSPALVPDMQQVQTGSYTLWIPGCATLSELANAREMGARMMKIFPANLLTPEFVASALSVIPDLKLMPTGGVEPSRESLSAWFSSGVACVGMGSQLISKEMLRTRDWEALHKTVSDAVNIAKQLSK